MTFLVVAYALLWLGVFGYVLRLASRLRTLSAEASKLAGGTEPVRHPLEPAAASSAGRAARSAAESSRT